MALRRDRDRWRRRTALKSGALVGCALLAGVPGSRRVAGQTGISECTSLDEPGEYVLEADIAADGDCFTIDAPDVTLRGNGHTISGDGEGRGSVCTPTGRSSRI